MKIMATLSRGSLLVGVLIISCLAPANRAFSAADASSRMVDIGIAVQDVTPQVPIRLAGYASRNRGADKVDHPLLAQAIAWRCESGEPFVLVSLDNCEVSREFTTPVLKELQDKHGLKPGMVMILSSHTHSAPILDSTLETMYDMPEPDREQIRQYSAKLRTQLVSVVEEALKNLQRGLLEYGVGRATFAMNRRVYRDNHVDFGDNPEGPVVWDVPVLRIKDTNDTVRAILFGYACHGTSVRSGDDFYVVSGEYMAYARQHLEAMHPGAVAVYITGMGADADPAPRGPLMAARRHGLELAGAVMSVLDRPMRPIKGPLRVAYEEATLPFVDPPGREQLEKDAHSTDIHVRKRAENYLAMLNQGKAFPSGIKLPLAALRFGNDLTLLAMGGEVVADYAIRFKRVFGADHPWMIGYAYEVPCYIPSARMILEGGYEVDSSLIYYGYYGPFRGTIDDLITKRMGDLVAGLRR
jgi:neutral ceramidase